MSISVVSTSAPQTNGNNWVVVDLDSTPILEDDLIILWFEEPNDLAITADPTGFTPVCDEINTSTGDDRQNDVQYMWASGGEESNSYHWVLSNSGPHVQGSIVLRGVDRSTPFDVTPVHASHHLTGLDNTTPACASIVTVTPGALIIELSFITGGNSSDAYSSNGSATEFVNFHNQTANPLSGMSVLGTYYEKATAGAYTGSTHTYVDGVSTNDYINIILAFRPAQDATPPGELVTTKYHDIAYP